jgi:hypothetical protein
VQLLARNIHPHVRSFNAEPKKGFEADLRAVSSVVGSPIREFANSRERFMQRPQAFDSGDYSRCPTIREEWDFWQGGGILGRCPGSNVIKTAVTKSMRPRNMWESAVHDSAGNPY